MHPDKKQARRVRNRAVKLVKAANRQAALVELGKLVEVRYNTTDDGGTKTNYELPATVRVPTEKSIPSLSWLGGKQYAQHGPQSKLRPGNKSLHSAAIIEDASRSFTKEVDKILNPPQEIAEETPVPVVPMDVVPEVAAL